MAFQLTADMTLAGKQHYGKMLAYGSPPIKLTKFSVGNQGHDPTLPGSPAIPVDTTLNDCIGTNVFGPKLIKLAELIINPYIVNVHCVMVEGEGMGEFSQICILGETQATNSQMFVFAIGNFAMAFKGALDPFLFEVSIKVA